MKIRFLIIIFLLFAFFNRLSGHELVGFWHNWNDSNAPYIHLDSIDNRYTYVAVAFSVPTSASDMNMLFTPENLNTTQFITKVRILQNRGKKVLLSIGGAYPYFDLSSETNKNAFVNSLTNLLETYGFDGLDIDIEHGNCIIITGGTISSPSNQSQINLTDAIRQIMSNYRSNFSRKMILTVSPETAYVQGGQSGFGNIWGGYLPFLHSLRDSIDILQVQLYNSGTMYGLDGNIYSQGTADFVIAMTEAVIRGFNTNGGFFQGFPSNKVAIGLPASPNAAGGGFVDSSSLFSAVNYLLGKGPRPGNYTLIQSGGYPNLLGMMTWSINWDAVLRNGSRYQYANSYSNIFIGTLPEKVALLSPAPGSLNNNSVKFVWKKSQPQVNRYQLNLYIGNNLIFSDSTITDSLKIISNLQYDTEYNWKVRAKNNQGWGSWSDTRYFNTFAKPSKVVTLQPQHGELLFKSKIDFIWENTTPNATDYQLEIGMNGSAVFSDSTIKDTIFTYENLKPGKLYTWMVRAKSNSLWGDWSTIKNFSTINLPEQVKLISPDNNLLFSENSIELVWHTNSVFVENYILEIYREKDLIVYDSSLTDTVYILNNLEVNKEYFWKIRAKNDFGYGDWSVLHSFRYLTYPEKVELHFPANNAVWINDSLVFTWFKSTPAIIAYTFELYRNDTLFMSFNDIKDTLHKISMPNDNYSWRVRATNEIGDGEWSEYRHISKEEKQKELPQQVILVSPENKNKLSETYVKLIWLASTPDIINYQLEISQNDSMVTEELNLTDTFYTFKNLIPGNIYKWKVRAINSDGIGPWSNTWTFESEESVNFINMISIGNKVLIAPNPAKDYIVVDIPHLERGLGGVAPVVRVFDVLGVCVITSPPATLHSGEGSKVRLNVSHLPPGVYFVQLSSRVQRFVKM